MVEPAVPPRPWLAEPARPDWIREHPNAHWFAVATVCVGAFMGQLDASIVTLALPALQHHFHAGLGAVTWVGLAYLVTLVSLVTAVGRLADMVGRKLLYTYGFLVFILGSALCGAAPGLGLLDGFRILQAIGAAMLQANSVAIVYLVMPPERLGRGIGVQGAAQALGLALGPTVGGFLIALGGWRWIFFVNVPFGVLGAGLGWIFLPRSRDLAHRQPFDRVGVVLLASSVGTALYAISFGNTMGWTSVPVIGAMVLAVGLAAGLVVRQRAFAHPLIPPPLVRRPGFSSGLLSGLLSYLVMFGTLFVVPFYLERRLGLGPGETGLVLTAMPAALAVGAPLGGRWADHVGPRLVTVVGMTAAAAALGALVVWHRPVWTVAVALMVEGAGLGLYTPANNAAIMGAAPRAEAGVAGGLLNMTRGIGTSLGLAVTSLVLGLVAGAAPEGRAAGHGFTVSAAFLAALALASAAVALARRRPDGPAPPALGESPGHR